MKCLKYALSTLIFLTFLGVSSQERIRMNPQKSILENTEESGNYQTLLAVVKAAHLDKVLGHDGPFTVFAPSDMAFKKLPSGTLTSLLRPENRKELYDILTYHIVAGNLSASKILRAMCRGKGKATFTTVQGDKITATMSGIDIVLTDNLGNSAKITTADVNQCNGVIHGIDTVILPQRIFIATAGLRQDQLHNVALTYP
ncbi:fasciclin domain-containing protein [Flavobacteriaceae bacterium F89]|uniref:Fasciclin domain-containing protein n=1 Tax=Cerina litoralis TaxID=2874477 RepID=A0AAE3JPG7_9FLAO|nr:fasciclin domain-containing protein [Cerina litoralis]MCG2461026.1 fasciclin domain-containing protein [Cerina litoralis]